MGRKKKPIVWKECPRCSTTHMKPGTYCSRKCANVRVISEEQRRAISNANVKFSQSNHPNAIKRLSNITKHNKKRKEKEKKVVKEVKVEKPLPEFQAPYIPPDIIGNNVIYVGDKRIEVDDEGVGWEVVGEEY